MGGEFGIYTEAVSERRFGNHTHVHAHSHTFEVAKFTWKGEIGVFLGERQQGFLSVTVTPRIEVLTHTHEYSVYTIRAEATLLSQSGVCCF